MKNESINLRDYRQVSVKAVHNPPIDEVTYIIYEKNAPGCVLIDPFDMETVEKALCGLGNPEWILLTHEHYDHIGAVNQLTGKYHCKTASSRICAERIKDPRKNMSAYYDALLELHGTASAERVPFYSVDSVDFVFERQEKFLWRDILFTLTETPGHSPGSICIQMENNIFTGDSLLRDTPIITKFPAGSRKDYQNITKPYLLNLSGDIQVYPGHGSSFFLGENKYLYPDGKG